MDATAPCRTLYVRNLPDKINKTKLRRFLHAAMSPYGNVVWIVAEKTMKLRGQAFLTFETQAEATTALRKMHATDFMGRQIAITYAKSISDRAASPHLGGDSAKSRKGRSTSRREQAAEAERAAAEEAERKAAEAREAAATQALSSEDVVMPVAAVPAPAPEPPNRILFVENLPKDVGEEEGGKPLPLATALTDLFARFAGFIEVRTVAGKGGIAFVEFGTEGESAIAMSGLQDHPLGKPPLPMKVSFAKK